MSYNYKWLKFTLCVIAAYTYVATYTKLSYHLCNFLVNLWMSLAMVVLSHSEFI